MSREVRAFEEYRPGTRVFHARSGDYLRRPAHGKDPDGLVVAQPGLFNTELICPRNTRKTRKRMCMSSCADVRRRALGSRQVFFSDGNHKPFFPCVLCVPWALPSEWL